MLFVCHRKKERKLYGYTNVALSYPTPCLSCALDEVFVSVGYGLDVSWWWEAMEEKLDMFWAVYSLCRTQSEYDSVALVNTS